MNDRIVDFGNKIKGKNVAVIGIAISNTPLIEFLSKYGARITAFDRSDAGTLSDRIERLKPCNIEYRLGPGYLSGLKGFDYIFKTPAIRPDIPEFVAESERGAIITSEMELFLELCPGTVFGITGSDGKTTTTTLVFEMLKAHGYNCYLGGNIGNPLISDVETMTATDMAVVELSSFQLLTMKKSVNIAIITNLSPNHLDVHKSYDEYIGAKKNIYAYQSPGDLCVLNYDNLETRNLCSEIPGRLGLFSRVNSDVFRDAPALPGDGIDKIQHGAAHHQTSNNEIPYSNASLNIASHSNASRDIMPNSKTPYAAVYVHDSNVYYKSFDENYGGGKYSAAAQVIRLDDILIPGPHNVENYLAAICAVYRYADRDDAAAVARRFAGVEHRLEHFRTLDGVRYYNDSKATNPISTIACLNSFDQKIILIAGGKDKDLDFAPLGRHIAEKVKLLILCGQTSNLIKQSLMHYCDSQDIPCTVPIIECESYEEAVSAARANAQAKDVVALSPAGTSFDRFNNFEERGRFYKGLVNAL